MTPDLQHVIRHYAERGWLDVNLSDGAADVQPRSAYLILASHIRFWPRSEVQVTTRCLRHFRAHKMVVAGGSSRFDLVDLRVGYRSQFTCARGIPLREYAELVCDKPQEVRPELICWPLDVCASGAEVCAQAIIPDGDEEGPWAEFEVVLLGEVVF